MNKYLQGYFEPRTLYHPDALAKWERGEYFPPIIAEIAPTGRCNQKCQYCYALRRVDAIEMDTDLLLRLPRELEQAGVKAILYQGDGDPLMHKRLADAITSSHLPQTISTNGVLFTPAFQDATLDRLNYVRFSVIDSDPTRYAWQHGTTEKQHAQLIENIRYAVNHRTRTMLMATIYLEPDSFNHAYEMVSYFKDLGLDYVVIMEAIYYALAPTGARKFTSEYVTAKQIADMKARVGTLADADFEVRFRFPNCETKTGVTPDTFYPGFCQGIHFEAVIAPSGDIIPCWRGWDKPDIAFGNLHEQTFEQIWRGERRKRITEWVLNTPPNGEECRICNQYKNNQLLEQYKNRTEWANFLI